MTLFKLKWYQTRYNFDKIYLFNNVEPGKFYLPHDQVIIAALLWAGSWLIDGVVKAVKDIFLQALIIILKDIYDLLSTIFGLSMNKVCSSMR